MRIISVDTMMKQLKRLPYTVDLDDWERDFIADLWKRYRKVGSEKFHLTEREFEKIEKIYRKSFAHWRY